MSKRIFWLSILSFFLIQVSPFISEYPKFFCQNLGGGITKCGFFEFKNASFFWFRLGLILFAVFISGYVIYFRVLLPQNKFEKGRKSTFDFHFARTLEKYKDEGWSVRINVMKATSFLSLGILTNLSPVYHYGFESKHRDSHLNFWVVKFKTHGWAQGNCGKAYLSEEPQLADLTDGIPFDYNLTKEKRKQTEYIKGIISIPVFEEFQENKKPKVIGVINIDTNDGDVNKKWVEDETCLNSFIEHFEKVAKIVSHFI